MSKTIFATVLKKTFPQLSITAIETYWTKAIEGILPVHIFRAIDSSLCQLPAVQDAYKQRLGEQPIIIELDQARRVVMEFLIEGPRYMREIRQLYGIPTELLKCAMDSLLKDKIITYRFCAFGNCIEYRLNAQLRLTRLQKKHIEIVLARSKQLSLYRLSVCSESIRYEVLCLWASSLLDQENPQHCIIYQNGRAVIVNREFAA